MSDYTQATERPEYEQRRAADNYYPGTEPVGSRLGDRFGNGKETLTQLSLGTATNELVSLLQTTAALQGRIEKLSLRLFGSIQASPPTPGDELNKIQKEMPAIATLHHLLRELDKKIARLHEMVGGIENVI